MGWFTALFSSQTVVEKATDGLYNGIDKAFYTAEEKEGDQQKRIDMFMKLLPLTQDASPARRYIAMIIMLFWLIIGIDVLVLINLSLIFTTQTEMFKEAIKAIIEFANSYVLTPTSIVLGFYFLTHVTKPFAPSKGDKK